MNDIQSYKIQKYQQKLQRTSQEHPQYQIYLAKYMYYLRGGKPAVKLLTQEQIDKIQPLLVVNTDIKDIKKILGCGIVETAKRSLASAGQKVFALSKATGQEFLNLISTINSEKQQVNKKLEETYKDLLTKKTNLAEKFKEIMTKINDKAYSTVDELQKELDKVRKALEAAQAAYNKNPNASLNDISFV